MQELGKPNDHDATKEHRQNFAISVMIICVIGIIMVMGFLLIVS